MSEQRRHVLVLGGGPDAEREVSMASAAGVAEALEQSGLYDVTSVTIDRLSAEQLKQLPGDVIFPALHGQWGEGGPMQDVLEFDGRAFVGSASRASRLAMDKLATKLVALREGIPTRPSFVLDLADGVCPTELPVVVKPVREGSTIGLHVCRDDREWAQARQAIEQETFTGRARTYMIEEYVKGREITVGVVDGDALPIVEIVTAGGLYDYGAKYERDDTRYIVEPEMDHVVAQKVQGWSVRLFVAMGLSHLARVDWILDEAGEPWLLEVNTMPGFTGHSLLPMAAKFEGMEMPALCSRLVELAVRDHERRGLMAGV